MNSISYKSLLPTPSIDSAPFWAGCNREILLLQHCADCNTRFYFARRLCPACGGQRLDWEPSTGTGTIFSFSEVHVSFFGPEWNTELPYTVVLIDLDEGPRMLSRLVGRNSSEVKIGDRVKVFFVEAENQKLPFFTL
ncbi:MAG: hypothetical protein EPN62_04005 [Candidimonas sp.]|nr:MAG: hypothetical protein EPN77_15755 [Candidimonas sp.]TAM25496.1 MAG: hypothetical protein EPN62_04005 [Candidimonas sp.]